MGKDVRYCSEFMIGWFAGIIPRALLRTRILGEIKCKMIGRYLPVKLRDARY